MVVELNILGQIANSVLLKLKGLSESERERIVQMNDYHGFLKSRLPEDFLQDILLPFQLTPNDVQIELAVVNTDLSNEIHYHAVSSAYNVILGEEYKFPNPRKAKVYLNDKWSEIKAGDIIKFPPNTRHGFTVEEDGEFFFLSVQNPPIVNTGGSDDYHKIEI